MHRARYQELPKLVTNCERSGGQYCKYNAYDRVLGVMVTQSVAVCLAVCVRAMFRPTCKHYAATSSSIDDAANNGV